MKRIRIKFVDWPYKSHEDNTFLQILESKYEVELSENPDFIFYSDFGYNHLNYDCIRIYYTPENMIPDFNICDYAIGFHHITFEDRYMRFPLYGLFHYKRDYERALRKHEFTDSEILKKDRFCNFIYSNSQADSIRSEFFDFLNNYKKVDSAGRFKNNVGGPVLDKFSFQRDYKFSIAFESSSMSGYITEKIIQAFAAQTIPIYWGDPNIDLYFNENSFINWNKFTSREEVLKRIIEIDNSPELFRSILKEPILKGKGLDYSDLANFITHIVEQGSNKFRRSNILRGKWYQGWHKKMARRDLIISAVRRRLFFLKSNMN